MAFAIAISPAGRLFLETVERNDPALSGAAEERAAAGFRGTNAEALEMLASHALPGELPADFAYWRGFARLFFTALCHTPDLGKTDLAVPLPPPEELARRVESAPPFKGLEYLTTEMLAVLWTELLEVARARIAADPAGAESYLRRLNPVWNALGRVTLHLAENKRNPERPFAFLATYSHRISEQGKVQHLPLGRALEEYAGSQNRNALTTLLSPLQRAAEKSKLVRELLDSRAIFHPQLFGPGQAHRFLSEIPRLEESGLSVRIPDWWKAGRPPRPQVSVRIGESKQGGVGADQILDFKVELTLDGETLTKEEWRQILASNEGLALIKGKWVEVDREKLQQVLDHWEKVQAEAAREGVSMLEGLRWISGYRPEAAADDDAGAERAGWSQVIAGEWLKKTLEQMQDPKVSAESDPGPELRAELRPYQREGVHWLWFMNRLGLGACLADDMGLGKTIQVISLLLTLRRRPENELRQPSLLVVPASLIGNWKAEIARFAPSLRAEFLHPSESSAERLQSISRDPQHEVAGCDLAVTSYGFLLRQGWLKAFDWNLLILDEAQAIKNPAARQTRAVKELRARCRIALSGTPIENRLGDLWSLFDFLSPGLLGGAKEFGRLVKAMSQKEGGQFAPLRRLVRPYILRRLKTDKKIISDLPEKTELKTWCALSREQAVLYKKSVEELEELLNSESTEGIKRRGIILAFLMRFKQICNHPAQWLGSGEYLPEKSGKFQRLREVAEEIASRQERVLVFTQYREMTRPLAGHLAAVFGRSGLVLDGSTAVKERKHLVDQFQRADGPPFFVLSLKAGGTGLNLTAAAHVIHFDRWWNPAVENQATDRAFRIGQKRNVMVHKFVCRGTLEERIDDLISGKSSLAEGVLGDGAERLLTEMSTSELLTFVSLGINSMLDE